MGTRARTEAASTGLTRAAFPRSHARTMGGNKLILDYVYDKEAAHPDRVWLTQPLGGGAVKDYTWGEALREARKMAAHL